MSLDISKLENVRSRGEKITARCPACAEAGQDLTRNHLFIQADGRFGCVVYPGDSPDASAHRKRIFSLCGNREIRPLIACNQRPADEKSSRCKLKGVLAVLTSNAKQRLQDSRTPRTLKGLHSVDFSPQSGDSTGPDIPEKTENNIEIDVANTITSDQNPARCGAQGVPGVLSPIGGVLKSFRSLSLTLTCKTCGKACAKGEPLAEYCCPQCWQASLLAPPDRRPQWDRSQRTERSSAFYEKRRRSEIDEFDDETAAVDDVLGRQRRTTLI
jgi:hypothetical protein